jgi:predicted small secreted protein
MKEKIKKTIATSIIIFSLLLTALSLSSCNDNTTTTTTTSIENLNSKSTSENKTTTTEETEFVFSTVETTITTIATIKPIEEILSEKDIDVELKDYISPEHNPMIKSVYNLYSLEDIYKLVPFFAENYPLYEDGSLSDSFINGIITRYEISLQTTTQEKLEPMVYLDMLYSIKSTYFPNKEFATKSNAKEEVLYILQNY